MTSDPTRLRIFNAARALFEQKGEAGLSMRRIAAAIGITPMAIYKHYADKDALLNALMLDGFADWEARVEAIAAPEPLAWVTGLGEAYLDFALSQPRRYEAAFLLRASAARRYPGDFAQGRSPVVSQLLARLAAAQAQGLLRETPLLEIALCFVALTQGLVSMYRAGRFADEEEFRAAYRRTAGHCLHSFLKEQPSCAS
jgi:AcrR family transcriptional regulator